MCLIDCFIKTSLLVFIDCLNRDKIRQIVCEFNYTRLVTWSRPHASRVNFTPSKNVHEFHLWSRLDVDSKDCLWMPHSGFGFASDLHSDTRWIRIRIQILAEFGSAFRYSLNSFPHSDPRWIRIRIQILAEFGSSFRSSLNLDPHSETRWIWIRIQKLAEFGSAFRNSLNSDPHSETRWIRIRKKSSLNSHPEIINLF